uniref:Thiol:disulfide interchange protein n=1 Tax=uncultured bacterium CSL1 TaxID=1091565 RepID=G4WVC0_9BACT|nr:thiol:disulfide interchange protein [uncultured bacterium CSL1]
MLNCFKNKGYAMAMPARISIILLFFSALIQPLPASAQFGGDIAPVSSAELLSENTTIAPASHFHGALHLKLQRGWHTYWRNAGDAGLPVSLKWTLPTGITVSDIKWPAPVPIKEGPITTYGYYDEVILPFQIDVAAQVAPGSRVRLEGRADWLACENTCVPQSAALALELPVADLAVTDDTGKVTIAHALARRPLPTTRDAQVQWSGQAVQITLPLAELKHDSPVKDALFFPDQPGWMNNSAAQSHTVIGDTLQLTLARDSAATEQPENIQGVLAVTFADGRVTPHAVHASQALLTPAATLPALPRMLLLALLGGLVLNLMPCVFPVLSLKALALAKHASLHPAHARAEGLAYTAGVVASFLLFAVLLIGLQQAGQSVGWGFQMQSPVFVGAMVFLLLLVGMNLSGLFELPVLLGGVGHTLTRSGSLRGSFFTGVLAVAVATPCTAPFMATALGFALTAPPIASLLVFTALGLGLALPFLLIGFMPGFARLLPRPGAWMERLRGLLAFPVYLSAIWLLWVLGRQAGSNSMVLMLCGSTGIVFALWLRKNIPSPSLFKKILVMIFLAGLPVCILATLHHMPDERPQFALAEDEVLYSASALEALRAQGKPVFVDATAAWCITCQLNKKVALSRPGLRAEFKRRGIVMMVADWTNADPEITKLLASFGQSGVPMYVYYPVSGEPRLLPQLLTESIVLEAVK